MDDCPVHVSADLKIQLDYVQLTEVLVDPNGSGLASLAVDGYGAPVSIYVGLAEAAAILYASGMESRRPSTISTWQHTIEVCHCSCSLLSCVDVDVVGSGEPCEKRSAKKTCPAKSVPIIMVVE